MYFAFLKERRKMRLSMLKLTRISLEINFVNHTMPSGGMSGLAYLIWRLKSLDVSAGQVSFIHALRYSICAVANAVQTVIAIVIVLAALQHIGVILPLTQGIQLEYMVRKTGPIPQGGNVVNTLEAQVVNGKHGLRPSHRGRREQSTLENRHQGSLPVVAVDHIRDPVHEIQGSQSGFGEEVGCTT